MSGDHAHRVGLLAVGDELLAGAHPDLNSPWLAARLTELGRQADRIMVVPDDEASIAEAVEQLAARAPLVVVSGGLGPTLDDVTRHGVARAAGRELALDEQAWSQVRAWYERAGRDMPASNERQALVPESGVVLFNPTGTAPGFRVEVGRATVFVLPGPPRELQAMGEEHLLPWVTEHPLGHEVFQVRRFHLFDLSESVFADRAGDWMERGTNPLMGVTVKGGILSAKLVARGRDEEEARARLSERGAEFLERFGDHVFSETSPDLALVLGEELLARNMTVTGAESCTGGMIAGELTRMPGISSLLRETAVTYSNEAKTERLGVPEPLLSAHGAVSAPVAEEMARGAAGRSGARLALSVTGIAGPGGGSPEKPVGLVWFGVFRDGDVVATARRWPDVGRDRVRTWVTKKGLSLLLRAARGEALGSLVETPG